MIRLEPVVPVSGRVFEVTKRSGYPLGDDQSELDEDVDAEVAAAVGSFVGPFVGLFGEYDRPTRDFIPAFSPAGEDLFYRRYFRGNVAL